MKQRIFFGLAPLFILLLAVGAYAVSLFSIFGRSIDVILQENYRSVLAGQQMKETAERMDSALSFTLVGEEDRARKMWDENLPAFRKALDLELHNITLPNEGNLANKVKSLHERYAERADAFWKLQNNTARRTMYFNEMLPTFTEVKDTAQEIIRINQDNMVRADGEAKTLAAHSTRYMLCAIAIGLGCAVYFAWRLQRTILSPIQTLTTVARDLGEGRLDQVVPVQSQDELGTLADAFNKMAAKLRAYRQVTSDQLLQARLMTEITLSAFPDAIVALSSEGEISFTNPAAHRLLGKLDLPNTLPPAVSKEAEMVLKGGSDYLPTSFERALIFRVDDQEIFLLPRIVAMRDESEKIFGAAVILQDVTRFRLMDDVKTNLVSTVSHELKTPLTSVRMGLHLLLEERIGTLNPKQTELLLAAREDSERLLRMINDMLDLAKLESGKSAVPHQLVSPRQLVENAAEDLRTLAESRGSKLLTEVSSDLSNVAVDAHQIAHVFSNFISNAVKHSKPGNEIVVKAGNHGSAVRFSVVDHGPGIAAEHQAKLFDRFYRVPGSETSGAGLGLAIAKEIVVAQGGSIGVRSQPGNGTEFYFDLPVAKPASSI